MDSKRSAKQLDERFKIAVVSAEDQMSRIEGVIARRAFLGAADAGPGHELQNWRHAKSDLVRGLCYGLIVRDEDVWVEADSKEFKEGTVEIWVSPRHATICGIPRKAVKGGGTQEENELVFRSLDLPIEVEPSAVTANLKGPILQICFPKAHLEVGGNVPQTLRV